MIPFNASMRRAFDIQSLQRRCLHSTSTVEDYSSDNSVNTNTVPSFSPSSEQKIAEDSFEPQPLNELAERIRQEYTHHSPNTLSSQPLSLTSSFLASRPPVSLSSLTFSSISSFLYSHKAIDICEFDMRKKIPYAGYFLLATFSSERAVEHAAENLAKAIAALHGLSYESTNDEKKNANNANNDNNNNNNNKEEETSASSRSWKRRSLMTYLEGRGSDWMILDCSPSIVFHFLTIDAAATYKLNELWTGMKERSGRTSDEEWNEVETEWMSYEPSSISLRN